MNNNDRLTRLRYALDIKDEDMIIIFQMGGLAVSQAELLAFLDKIPNEDRLAENEYGENLSDAAFERFLNGLIISENVINF